MTIMRFTSAELSGEIDLDRFTLDEAIVVEEQTGLDLEGLGARAEAGNMRAMGAFLWVARLRQIAAEKDISILRAAVELPRERFDPNLIDMEVKTEDPTSAPAKGRQTRRTSRGTSARSSARPARARSGANSDASTSAPSLNSSESDPGKSDS